MKVFISQPMRGLTDEQILNARELAVKKVQELYSNESIDVLPSFFDDVPSGGNIGLKYLGMSLNVLADADLAFFCEGWEDARGCEMELLACKKYGIPHIAD